MEKVVIPAAITGVNKQMTSYASCTVEGS